MRMHYNSDSDPSVTLYQHDMREAMWSFPDAMFDGCLCDPPYGLSFMGKTWDHGIPGKAVWEEVLRVLKPGAFLLAFGGTRTHHRLMCAIEDAGFEIRDCMMWLYGQGFPKSLDIGKTIDKAAGSDYESKCTITAPATDAAKRWDGYGTALKPAFEPIIVAAVPLTLAQYFGMMVQEITNQICRIFSAQGAERSFSDTRAKLQEVLASTVHENVRTCSPESIESALFAPPLSISRGRVCSDRPEDVRGSSAQSPAKRNGKADETLESQILAGAADDISTRLTDMCMSVMAGATSESIVSLWKSTSEDLLSVANKFTIETASRLIIGLRTFRSFLAQTTLSGTGNLSPEYLPIIVAMKPCEGTFAENALKHGVAGISINSSRIACDGGSPSAKRRESARNTGNAPMQQRTLGVAKASDAEAMGKIGRRGSADVYMTERAEEQLGRWPANVILDEESARLLDEQSGDLGKSSGGGMKDLKRGALFQGTTNPNVTNHCGLGDSGGASRFFYCAKASKSERGEGNNHPTVKPLKLIEYLARLILPPDGGQLLVPFSGSGSEVIGARNVGWDVTGIEIDQEYLDISVRRVTACMAER